MEAERRQVTVLFADMVSFTSFSERSGEEAAFTLMRSLSKLMDEAVREQGGVVRGFTGDGIMAVFGVPVALEDAPLRACRAALGTLQRLKETGPDIEAKHGVRPQLRIGLNTGASVVGKVEESADAGVTVLGDTVNFAARLQALAEPDSMLMSEATHRLVQGMVDANYVGEHTIKGKTEPQKVYRLDAVRRGATRFDAAISHGLSAFVGRERELEILERALDAARSQLRVVDLVAEPGMGKSRLLHEFRQRIGKDRTFILSGRCSPDGQQTPFLPFIEVVRGSFRVSAGEAEQDVAQKLERGLTALGLNSTRNLGLLLHLLGLKITDGALTGLDGVLIGLRTRELLQQLLEARTRLSPVVMVIEDLHWIDSASEELLRKIIDSEGKLRLLLLTTRRPEYATPWLDRAVVTKLLLEPLPIGDIRRLIGARPGAEALPEPLAWQVAEKAEGNPLFAEEIVSFLSERGIAHTSTGKLNFDATALPASVQSLLTARVDRLTSSDRAVLQAASVIGRHFDPQLLAAATGEIDLDARLAFHRGRMTEARDVAQELMRVGRLLGDPRSTGLGLALMTWIALVADSYTEALEYSEQSLGVAVTHFDRNTAVIGKGCALVLLRRTEEGAQLLERDRRSCVADGDVYRLAGSDGIIGVCKVLQGNISAGIHFLEEAILRQQREGYRDAADWYRFFLCEVYLQIIAGNEKPSLLTLLKNLPIVLKVMATGTARIRVLMSQLLDNQHFDREGHHAGHAQMILGLLYKAKKKRALAVQHLIGAKRILLQFGQTPILARVEGALAELGQ